MELFPNYTFFFQLAIFLTALFILAKFVFKPIIALLDERTQKSAGTLSTLTHLETALAEKSVRYEKALAEARLEALKLKDKIREDALQEEKKIVSAARAESDAALLGLRRELQSELVQGKTFLDGQAKEIAKLIVRKVLAPRRVVSILLCGLFFGSASGMASESAEGAMVPTLSLLYQFVNFSILALGLFFLLRKPVRAFFADRKHQIATALSKADAQRKEFEAKAKAIEARLATLDHEIKTITATIVSTAEAEKEALIRQANALAAKIQGDIAIIADQELTQAHEALRRHTVGLALVLAQEELSRTLDSDAEDRRIDRDIIQELRGIL